VLGLEAGCCPEVASGRHLIYGREFKNAFDEDGNHHSAGRLREVPWVAIPPVVGAIRVLEKIASAEGLLFDAATHTFVNTPTPSTASLRYSGLRSRIEAFVSWASGLARSLGREGEVIPDDPYGAIGLARFRRTLAWHIARRPGGLVALAIRYGHMRTAVSGGYAARGRDGIHQLLDTETARATADTLTTLHDDLARGVGISGTAARGAIHAAAQAPAFAGSIRTHRQARDILGNPALNVHDNELVQHARSLEKQAAFEAVPGPLADRLARRAAQPRALADRHEHDRIHPQEPTSESGRAADQRRAGQAGRPDPTAVPAPGQATGGGGRHHRVPGRRRSPGAGPWAGSPHRRGAQRPGPPDRRAVRRHGGLL
jgi:hypothetical protein